MELASNFEKLLQRDVGTGFLVASIGLFTASVLSYYQFLQIDFFTKVKSNWSTPAGYTKLQFAYLVLGTYFVPMAIIFMSIFVSKSFKQIPHHAAGKFPIYLSVTLLFLVGCIASASYAGEVLGCIGYFCIGTSGTTKTSSGTITVNMVFFSICLYFLMAMAGVASIVGTAKYPNTFSTSRPAYSEVPRTNDALSLTENHDRVSDKLFTNNLRNLRIAEHRHRKAYALSWLKEMAMISLVFIVLYPLMILSCTILPTWWSGFTLYKIQQYQQQIPDQSNGFYWAVSVNDHVILKLFPDILIYYSAIYFVSLVGLAAQLYPPLKRLLHRRMTPSVCVGQFLLGIGLVALLVVSWLYWFLTHVYENNPRKIRTIAELAARSFGQIANVVIGLLVLPVAKNGVWSHLFGVSWEGMIIYHKILGYTFLLIVLAHMFSWWKVYSQKGSFPSDIFAVPMIYHADNFTVPLSVLTSFFMFVIMGGFTFHIIRRKNYELFYYLHLFSGVIFLSVLWHATMSWYYITAGLVLYALDNFVRLSNTITTTVRVEELSVDVVDTTTPTSSSSSFSTYISTYSEIAADTPISTYHSPRQRNAGSAALSLSSGVTGVTKLSYCRTGNKGEAPSPLTHLMGQYVYLNIPAVSCLEWHPFTISSSPVDSLTTHHIKVMGGVDSGQWTAKLHLLARSLESQHQQQSNDVEEAKVAERLGDDDENTGRVELTRNGVNVNSTSKHDRQRDALIGNSGTIASESLVSSILVNVDGPYGLSVAHELHKYSFVLLIGGGIGVTPLHSVLRHLVLMKMCACRGHVEGGRGEGRNTGAGGILESDSGCVDDYHSLAFPFPDLKRVELVWSVRSMEEIEMFADTLNLIAQGAEGISCEDTELFAAKVHVTKKENTETNSRTPSPHSTYPSDMVAFGRPDLRHEISRLECYKHRALVFVCGPSQMVDEAAALSMQYGVEFRHETFEL